uniref:RNA-directed RNA polymerase n=1 Tax=Hubei levi-like virus 14 TaxID=1922913 RepID=A0A1L3KIQ4_9VIRU|nr:hypothetical protein [Hubei levi-like virus 14]
MSNTTIPTTRLQEAVKMALVCIKQTPERPARKGKPVKGPTLRSTANRVKVDPWSVAAVILEELSYVGSHVGVNFLPELEMLRKGDRRTAYNSILSKTRVSAVTPEVAWLYAQARACVSKLDVPGFDPLSAAFADWEFTEHRCRRVNQKLAALQKRHLANNKPVPFLREITRAREYISYVLGSEPDLDEVIGSFKFGPGSSVGVSGSATDYLTKLHSWDCTSRAIPLAVRALILDGSVWDLLSFDYKAPRTPELLARVAKEIEGTLRGSVENVDKLSFVYKKATMSRSIGIQPTISGGLQLGVDTYYKRLLKQRAFMDLADQSVNQRLARIGSQNWREPGTYATLDKSSASNLVAKGLITLLFPSAHRELLFALRTPSYLPYKGMVGEGSPRAYHMYAGMGNGTTFCVETLVFSAMCYAVSDLESPQLNRNNAVFSVYGDDVAIREQFAIPYILFAEFLGMKINRDKSFHSGPFRESCGSDYWDGINVRPTYVPGDGDVDELKLIGVHNSLMDNAFFSMTNACKRLRSLWQKSCSLPLPSDPQGGLGFRTQSNCAWEYLKKGDSPVVSPVWHRPLGYVCQVIISKKTHVGVLEQMAIASALQKAYTSPERSGDYLAQTSLRRTYTVKVIRETDLRRKDLVTMLANQLKKLGARKGTPWWVHFRGR